jgi:hypothetical protein
VSLGTNITCKFIPLRNFIQELATQPKQARPNQISGGFTVHGAIMSKALGDHLPGDLLLVIGD